MVQHHYSWHYILVEQMYLLCYLKTTQMSTKKGNSAMPLFMTVQSGVSDVCTVSIQNNANNVNL